jgi:hypothetical protein
MDTTIPPAIVSPTTASHPFWPSRRDRSLCVTGTFFLLPLYDQRSCANNEPCFLAATCNGRPFFFFARSNVIVNRVRSISDSESDSRHYVQRIPPISEVKMGRYCSRSRAWCMSVSIFVLPLKALAHGFSPGIAWTSNFSVIAVCDHILLFSRRLANVLFFVFHLIFPIHAPYSMLIQLTRTLKVFQIIQILFARGVRGDC